MKILLKSVIEFMRGFLRGHYQAVYTYTSLYSHEQLTWLFEYMESPVS